MTKIIVRLDKYENKLVEVYKNKYSLKTKADAVKQIIMSRKFEILKELEMVLK